MLLMMPVLLVVLMLLAPLRLALLTRVTSLRGTRQERCKILARGVSASPVFLTSEIHSIRLGGS